MSKVVTLIEMQLKRTHHISEKDANILLATIKAQESRIAELEQEIQKLKAEKVQS